MVCPAAGGEISLPLPLASEARLRIVRRSESRRAAKTQRKLLSFMYLQQLLQERIETTRPVCVGLIGAGKFGTMFLNQVPSTNGLEVAVIADLEPARAHFACRSAGWSETRLSRTRITDDAQEALTSREVEVVVEATGEPAAGLAHACAAIASGKHVVMVNVEADALAGPLLAAKAREQGVVYSLAYGDQPALICEMVEWARVCGFEVVAAGKGTKFLPSYHASTPDTVWDLYGLTAERARAAGMNSKMFNSFLDGTKSAIEMAAVANATGLVPPHGLKFPPCGRGDLAKVLRPKEAGRQLHQNGQVEVVSSLERDGSPVQGDLRWGVFVVFRAPNDYAASCFREYGMDTDETGRYASMYKPFHFIGLELNISILSAALLGRPTGAARSFVADVVTTAKRDLSAGEVLDGEGGYTVYGKLFPSSASLARQALPMGLAQGLSLRRAVRAGETVRWDDVEGDPDRAAIQTRRELEARFAA